MGYILVGAIIGGIIWGIVVNKVIENKGYEENWFWWGFFFGIFALIVALTKKSVNTTKVVIESSAPVKENRELLSSCTLSNQVNISSPVHIASWEIKKDAEKLVLFVDFINVSHKEITAVMFSATGYNMFGDRVQVNDANFFEIIGQDLSAKPNECEKVYTTLQDESIRKVEIIVEKICFSDGTILDDIPETWIKTNQKPLDSIHIECAKKDNPQSKYYAIFKEDYWQCTCGFVNVENNCKQCALQKEVALGYTEENIEEIHRKYSKELVLEERNKKEQQELRKRKQKRIKNIVIVILCVSLVSLVVLNTVIIPEHKYRKVKEMIKDKHYMEAVTLIDDILNYKDVKNLKGFSLDKIREKVLDKVVVGYSNTIGLKSDGTVVTAGDNEYGQRNTHKWEDIVAVSADAFHTVGLKSDGTVIAVGSNKYGQCDVQDWENVVKVYASFNHTVGLKSDGTVVATGENEHGQCNVRDWEDIVAVSAAYDYTVGLKSDGTVIAVGSNIYGQCNVQDWKDIVSVFACNDHTVGLKSDGTVVAVGSNKHGQCDVQDWEDIATVSVEEKQTVGLKSDGTVVAVGNNNHNQCNIQDWEDIVVVFAGYDHTIGLKSDGTVVAVGNNEYGQCDVQDWENIAAVFADSTYTVGLKSNGTVVVVGRNSFERCDISGWDLTE